MRKSEDGQLVFVDTPYAPRAHPGCDLRRKLVLFCGLTQAHSRLSRDHRTHVEAVQIPFAASIAVAVVPLRFPGRASRVGNGDSSIG